MGHQGLEFFAMVDFYFAKATIDCSTKGNEGVVMTTVQDLFLSELPNGAGFNGSVTFQSRRFVVRRPLACIIPRCDVGICSQKLESKSYV